MHRSILTSFQSCVLVVVAACFTGCDSGEEVVVEKKPRPVAIKTLKMRPPPASSNVSAVVASWKTEEIGFEEGGRIEWVVEPNTDIEARVRDELGNDVIAGTPIAGIDPERYELQVQSAEADVVKAEQDIKTGNIEKERTIPSQIEAARAELKRAEIEYERSKRLFKQNAGAEADVDRDLANLKNASAQVDQLEAQLISKDADLQSRKSALSQANKSLRDAQRNHENCILYSSFRGRISEVNVVPGSVVAAGESIATLQMMDPIKIELEVSAEESRRLRNRQRLPVMVTMEDGSVEERDGFLYLVDPVADSLTRTFTLTLLMVNERLKGPADSQSDLATTDQTWRIDFQFLPGAKEGKLYAPLQVIQKDDQGFFLWRIKNLTMHDSLPPNNLLDVEKMRIDLKETRLPFLGTWTFCEIDIKDSNFDPSMNLVAGKIAVKDGDPSQWNGTQVVVEKSQGQWMLRPGDLVQVDLTNNDSTPALFVEMEAVARFNNKSYLFLIDEKDGKTVVVRQPIEIVNSDESKVSTMLQIRSINQSESTLVGRQYVTKGTHYLRDGESVRVVASESN